MRTVSVAFGISGLFLFSWNASATSLTQSQVQNVCGSSYHQTPGGAQGCSKEGANGSMTYYYCDKDGKNCGAIVVAKKGSTKKLPTGVGELGSPARVNR